MEFYRQQHIRRRTSLRNRRPASVGGPIRPVTSNPALREERFDISASMYQRMRKMRTTVTIDDDVFEAVRAQAEASGLRLGQVLSQLARKGLRSSADIDRTRELPVFRVPSDAAVTPGTRARDLLAEDGP